MARRGTMKPYHLTTFGYAMRINHKMLFTKLLRGRPFRRRTARVCRARSICAPAVPPPSLAAAACLFLSRASSVEESEEPPPPPRRPPPVQKCGVFIMADFPLL